MKKVRMIVEMDEELYKAFAEQDVFISGMRTGKTLLSEIWKALKNATIVRMSEEKIKESCSLSLVYNEGFDKGYEKAKAEYKPKECDDAVSRQVVKEQMIKYGFRAPDMTVTEFVEDLPPVTSKHEQGEWIFEEVGVRTQVLKCSKCGTIIQRGENFTQEEFRKYINDILREKCITLDNFCHNCGAKMKTENEE